MRNYIKLQSFGTNMEELFNHYKSFGSESYFHEFSVSRLSSLLFNCMKALSKVNSGVLDNLLSMHDNMKKIRFTAKEVLLRPFIKLTEIPLLPNLEKEDALDSVP